MSEIQQQQQQQNLVVFSPQNVKKYFVVEDGVVTNLVLSDPDFAQEMGYVSIDGNEHVTIGFLYENGTFRRNLEREWNFLRLQRDLKLKYTDSLMYPDRFALLSQEKQQELLNYRQTLRDIPQTINDPDDVIWPDEPNLN